MKTTQMTPLEMAIDSFKPTTKTPKKRGIPHRIKYQDQFITTNSGKTVWSNIGAAKNALRNHVYCTVGYEYKDEVYDELMKLVEFVPLEDK